MLSPVDNQYPTHHFASLVVVVAAKEKENIQIKYGIFSKVKPEAIINFECILMLNIYPSYIILYYKVYSMYIIYYSSNIISSLSYTAFYARYLISIT